MSLGLNADAQLSLFATLLQVSAAFLALYFTAISVVTSTGYARAPGQLRLLVMQEQVGSFYFRVLALFVGLTTVMLTAIALKMPVGILNTTLASFFCLFAAFTFVVLGIRTFQYFDPIALVPHVNREILRRVQAVTSTGYQWTDGSFQHHHQQQAEDLLNRYSDLVVFTAQTEDPNGKGLVELARGLLHLVAIYAGEKRHIPTSSLWFRRRYRHKDWLLAPYFEVEVALATGTIPQPQNEPDVLWFETEVGRILDKIGRKLKEKGDSAAMSSLASDLNASMSILSEYCALDEAIRLFDAMVPHFREQCVRKVHGLGDQQARDLSNSLGIIEAYTCALMNAALGLSRVVKRMNVEAFDRQFGIIDWLSREALYKSNIFPRKVLEECEWVQGCLEFEFHIEKRILTPVWFRKERPARGFVEYLVEAGNSLVTVFEQTYGKEAECLATENEHVLAAQLIQRGLECAKKLTVTLDDLQNAAEDYSKLNHSKEWEWPKADWSKLRKRVAAVREQLLISLATTAPLLAELEVDNLPDYFGQAYSVLADECLTAMIDGNEQLLSYLYASYFTAAMRASERLRLKLLSDPQNIRVSAEPLADLLAISGYAAVFSALDNRKYWKLVTNVWDGYLATFPDSKAAKSIIAFFCHVTELSGRLYVRDVLRMRWKQAVEGVFRQRKLMTSGSGDYFEAPSEALMKHESSLIRVFARGMPFLTEPSHVFLGIYLLKRPEAAEVEWPRGVENFSRSLEREEKQRNMANDEGN